MKTDKLIERINQLIEKSEENLTITQGMIDECLDHLNMVKMITKEEKKED